MNSIGTPKAALVADDDEFFRIAIRSVLSERVGIAKIIEATSLDEALECLAENSDIAIAMLDLDMPGMHNAAHLSVIREHFPHVRVVVVSASSRRADILAALDAGAHGYIPKGIGVAELAKAIRSVLDGVIYVPPSLAECGPAPAASPEPEHPLDAPPSAVLDHLTPRQREVLEQLVQSRSNKEIARHLGLGEGTVKIHVAALLRNLGARNRSAAAVIGERLIHDD